MSRGAYREGLIAGFNWTEERFRPDVTALTAHYVLPGTMNQCQREHVVQFITEVGRRIHQ